MKIILSINSELRLSREVRACCKLKLPRVPQKRCFCWHNSQHVNNSERCRRSHSEIFPLWFESFLLWVSRATVYLMWHHLTPSSVYTCHCLHSEQTFHSHATCVDYSKHFQQFKYGDQYWSRHVNWCVFYLFSLEMEWSDSVNLGGTPFVPFWLGCHCHWAKAGHALDKLPVHPRADMWRKNIHTHTHTGAII